MNVFIVTNAARPNLLAIWSHWYIGRTFQNTIAAFKMYNNNIEPSLTAFSLSPFHLRRLP